MTTADTDHLGVQLYEPGGTWVDVGALHRSEERSTFESFASYWDGVPRPVLGQVFEERGPGWRPTARTRLPPWFSHLLPEGRLREAIASAAGVKAEREFFLLARIGGEDLPGAVRLVETTADASAVGNRHHDDTVLTTGDLGPLKFSLAGVQLKFSVRANGRGLTIPARGEAGDWIAKLPDPRPGFRRVPEAEFAGLELARAAGIDVPEAKLVDVADITGLPPWASATPGQVLLIRRFDRTGDGGRVHVEELAQILDVPTGKDHFKYERANFETVGRSTARLCGEASVQTVIDRIVVNVLVGNGDAHAKNWAFCYPDGQRPVPSPAYDIVPTVLYVEDDDLGLKLAGSRRFEDVSVSSFARLADKAGWDATLGRQAAVAAIERVIEAWPILTDLLNRDDYSRLTTRRDSLRLLRSRAQS